MIGEWVEPVVWGAVAVAIIWFFVAAMRKARRRRREEFSDEPARPVTRLPEPEAVAASPTDDPRDLEQEPEEIAPAGPVETEEADSKQAVEAKPRHVDPDLRRGLERTSSTFLGKLNAILSRQPDVSPAVLDELEEYLLTADVGVGLTTRLVDHLRGELRSKRLQTAEAVRAALKSQIAEAFAAGGRATDPLESSAQKPWVVLFVGVNGVGKTTTIGKVAAAVRARGRSVVLAAGDTFRAAAVEQLTIWGERTESRVIRGDGGADPASVVFNAVEHGVKTGADVVLADTAGRLHTKAELMDEIKKVKRAAGKACDGAPHETWLVVDATTGQNALQQAREFHQTLGLTGLVLTKLDGTAKGGVVVAIADALKLPIRFVGVGEKASDLRPFDPRGFVEALFATP